MSRCFCNYVGSAEFHEAHHRTTRNMANLAKLGPPYGWKIDRRMIDRIIEILVSPSTNPRNGGPRETRPNLRVKLRLYDDGLLER